MFDLSKSKELKGRHEGATFLVAGCAPSLADLDLYPPSEVVSIGPNRILNHPHFVPNYVMLCDRLPYSIDYKMGIYHEFASQVTYLASTTLWDPSIRCRGYPVVPEPDFPHYPWRVGVRSTPINLDSFEELLCSFATIAGPMIQAAVIMGAKRIGVVGVDLQAPIKGSMHFYKEGKGEELRGKAGAVDGLKDISPKGCIDRFHDLKKLLAKRGVEIANLSPAKNTPFSSVFPTQDFEGWINA